MARQVPIWPYHHRGTHKEVNAYWLSVWEGFFRIGIMLPIRYHVDALALPLGTFVRDKLDAPGRLGGMKTIPLGFDLCDDTLFADIYTLIDFKKSLK